MLSKFVRIILGSLACIFLAYGAFTWATGLMDSLFAYRSPLRNNPPAPGAALGEALTRRVVFVLVDSLREDTALDAQVMPYLSQLRAQGAWASMHSQPPSYSQPGYAVLLTGAWPDLSDGPAMNLDYEAIPTLTQDNLFSAGRRAGLKTAISAFNWFEKLVPQASLTASYYTAGEEQIADREVLDAAMPWLRAGEYQLILIHLDQVDYAGHHEGGPRDPRWNQAARRVDDLLREIGAELDFSQDTLLVTSDHGQIDQGGHGGHEAVTLAEPFVLVGVGVKPGAYDDIDMVDVAPTLAVLLGMNLPGSSQGAARLEMLSYPAEELPRLSEETQAQQARLLAAYQNALGAGSGSSLEVELGSELAPGAIVQAYQQEIRALREARLQAERLPRIGLAVLLGLLPALIIGWKRGRSSAWYFAGAALFVSLFHLRYGVLAGNTYSLSSVVSADDLINTVLITSLVALAVSWLLVAYGLKLFRQPPSRAFELSLGFVFTAIYLVSLPILLSYALNGLVVRWTLPHFPSLFPAFLAVLQALVVAAGGLLFAGIAALIAWILGRRVSQNWG